VIFDSHRAGGWNALYMVATAERLDDVDEAIRTFSRHGEAQGFRAWTRDDVLAPARHRLYRATVTEHFVLDPHDERRPVHLT
jgi:hypothetical protein